MTHFFWSYILLYIRTRVMKNIYVFMCQNLHNYLVNLLYVIYKETYHYNTQ